MTRFKEVDLLDSISAPLVQVNQPFFRRPTKTMGCRAEARPTVGELAPGGSKLSLTVKVRQCPMLPRRRDNRSGCQFIALYSVDLITHRLSFFSLPSENTQSTHQTGNSHKPHNKKCRTTSPSHCPPERVPRSASAAAPASSDRTLPSASRRTDTTSRS